MYPFSPLGHVPHRTYLDLALDANTDEMGLLDASSLRRQVKSKFSGCKSEDVGQFSTGIHHVRLENDVCLIPQIVKLNRRLQLLEEENKERSKREMFMYSATVAFWLINTWIWLRR